MVPEMWRFWWPVVWTHFAVQPMHVFCSGGGGRFHPSAVDEGQSNPPRYNSTVKCLMECGGVVGVGVRNSLRGGDQGVCPLVTLAQWNSSPCRGLLSYSWSTPHHLSPHHRQIILQVTRLLVRLRRCGPDLWVLWATYCRMDTAINAQIDKSPKI